MRSINYRTTDSTLQPSHDVAGDSIRFLRAESAALALLVVCSVACGADDTLSADDEASTLELGTNAQALGYPFDFEVPWSNGVVPYCYQPSPPVTGHAQPGSTDFDDAVERIDSYIAKYEAIPGADIDFQGGALCANWDDYILGGDPSTLRILITTEDGAIRSCNPGTSIAQGEHFDDSGVACGGVDFTKEALVGLGTEVGGATILHELGHALGFGHEYYRRSDGCNPGATGSVSNGITAYDLYGVVNATYCHWRTVISELDEVGFAFVYPGATADRLTIPTHSFQLPGAVVLTADDNDTTIEFAQRVAGVQAHHYSAALWLKSTSSGSTQIATGSAVSLGTVLASSSEITLRGRFTDFVGRVRTTPYVTFLRNPSQFGALVSSTTAMN